MLNLKNWMKVVENLQTFSLKKRQICNFIYYPIVLSMVRKGIPDYFRGYLWRYFIATKERKEFPYLYKNILKLCNIKECYIDQIKKDLKRLTPIKTNQEIEHDSWYEL